LGCRIKPEIAKRGKAGDVFRLDKLLVKLLRFRKFKKERQESLDPHASLFCDQSRKRLSKRRVQFAWL